jgi:hypothetical protein
MKIKNELLDKFGSEMYLTAEEDSKTTLKNMKKYCESLIKEIENRIIDNLLI